LSIPPNYKLLKLTLTGGLDATNIIPKVLFAECMTNWLVDVGGGGAKGLVTV